MKKIISLIASIAMISSAFVASVSAATVSATLAGNNGAYIETTTMAITADQYLNEWVGEPLPEGQHAFVVTATLKGIDLAMVRAGSVPAKKNKRNGVYLNLVKWEAFMESMDGVESFMKIDGLASEDVTKSYISAGASAPNVSGAFPVAASDTDTPVTASEYFVCQYVIAVSKTVSTNLVSRVEVIEVSEDAYVGNLDLNPVNNIIDGVDTDTFTLKASQPDPEVTVTGVDAGEVVTDGVNGKVWNDVKIENATLGTNYRAKFTETVSGETSTHKFRNLGELGGTATFAVVLNTARDVANIVLEILYDAVQ